MGNPVTIDQQQALLKAERRRTKRAVRIARALAIAAAATIATISAGVIVGSLDSTRALAAALAAGAALALAVGAVLPASVTQQALGQLRILKLGSFLSFELAPYERLLAATDRVTATRDERNENDDAASATNLTDLKQDFEMRLAYLAKWVLAIDPRYVYASADLAALEVVKSTPVKQRLIPTYVNVGSMIEDGYFTKDEGEIAYGIIGMQKDQLNNLPVTEREIFLKAGNDLANNMRIRVFYKQVLQQISRLGWSVGPAGNGAQRDLSISAAASNDQHHIIPVMSENAGSSYVKLLTARLSTKPKVLGNGRRLLIVPPLYHKGQNDDELLLSGAAVPEHEDEVWRVTLNALTLWLGRAPQ